MVCVDASCVISLVTGQNPAVEKQFLEWNRSQVHFVAPNLLFYEVTNGLYRYAFEGILSRGAIELALEAALGLGIRLYGDDAVHRSAVRIASDLALSATYDAHYLALADRLGIELWTIDKRLERTARKKFPGIRLFF